MFPLSAVLFPHASIPLHVFEPRYRALMRHCLDGDPRFGIVLIERGSEVGGGDQRSRWATRAVITRAAELPDGRWVLEVRGEAVVEIEQWLDDDPYPLALVSERHAAGAEPDAASVLEEATRRVRRTRALLAEHGGAPALAPDAQFDGGGDVEAACWQVCGVAPLNAYDAQRLLAVPGPSARLRLLADLMDELELDLRRMAAPE
jgi:Lon protease-like protein